MSSELAELYQEMILDHSRSPRHKGRLDTPTHTADGHNPLCGDRIHLELTVEGDRVIDVAFEGEGCAICTASSSMMAERLVGSRVEDADKLFDLFHQLVTGDADPDCAEAGLGKVAALVGVRKFPVRVKCATLAWHTYKAALEGGAVAASTE